MYLKICDIKGRGKGKRQNGPRIINVEIQYANDKGMGCIVLSERNTQQEICRRETSKTEADQKIEIV